MSDKLITKVIPVFLLLLLLVVSCFTEDHLEDVTCNPSFSGYIVPDPVQCDRYAECSPEGDKQVRLCSDGLVLSQDKFVCDLPARVDCSSRPKLQTPKSNGICPRPNGQFPLPAELTCSRYVDCQDGQVFIQNCGFGAVFDPVLGCVHPDQTERPGCTAEERYQFKCPPLDGLLGKELKFGDHERLAHPTDCTRFYACLLSGQPRRFSCKKPKVFNPETGLCDHQENVAGCEDTYLDNEIVNLEEERKQIAAEVRRQLELEFGLLGKGNK